jgi:hypothetical protein
MAAISSDKVNDDMLASSLSDNVQIPTVGLSAADMTEAQRTALMGVVALYASDVEDAHAAIWLQNIAAHLDETTFAWIGPTADHAVF